MRHATWRNKDVLLRVERLRRQHGAVVRRVGVGLRPHPHLGERRHRAHLGVVHVGVAVVLAPRRLVRLLAHALVEAGVVKGAHAPVAPLVSNLQAEEASQANHRNLYWISHHSTVVVSVELINVCYHGPSPALHEFSFATPSSLDPLSRVINYGRGSDTIT